MGEQQPIIITSRILSRPSGTVHFGLQPSRKGVAQPKPSLLLDSSVFIQLPSSVRLWLACPPIIFAGIDLARTAISGLRKDLLITDRSST